MKKIASHNEENKKKIAKTIAVIFDDNNDIPKYIQKMLLEKLIWATTENNDQGEKKKYFGQPYWSAGAIKQLFENKATKQKNNSNLIHEHAVPKKVLIEKIENLKTKNQENILNVLTKFGHAVVVSKQEDICLSLNGLRSKMPKNSSDIFARYKTVGIELYDMKEKNSAELILSSSIKEFEKIKFK